MLAGGQSRRMGVSKASLLFAGEPMLVRVLRVLEPIVSLRLVVAAPGQALPELPAGVRVVRDRVPGRGPLEGLAAGLAAGQQAGQQGAADCFYLSSCDVPLLRESFVRRMFQLLAPGDSIVVPRDDTHLHPLAGVYRADILPVVERLLAAGRLRPTFLFEEVPTRVVEVAALQDVDPGLLSLRNVNTPVDVDDALRTLAEDA